MWIMIAGPYRSGSADASQRAGNLQMMNDAAWQVFNKGHVPIIGVNLALPVIEAAGQEHYERLMMPISLALASRCDAILRIGGESLGADREVLQFREKKLPVYFSVYEVPDVEHI